MSIVIGFSRFVLVTSDVSRAFTAATNLIHDLHDSKLATGCIHVRCLNFVDINSLTGDVHCA